jgi:two-component system, OmpR family, phosphate regulon sensor histidine kinase PhoR
VKRNSIRLLLALAGLCISGITITQIYWVRKAFDIKEQEFTVNVSLDLKNIAESILKHDHKNPQLPEPVTRLSYKYFVADVDAEIPPALLDSLVRSEFAKRAITSNFGYVIYEGDKLVYSRCVAVSSPDTNNAMLHHLPGWDKHRSFFGVYFPAENSLIFSSMGIWAFSSGVLVLVILFFCYTLFIILRQKRLSEVQRDFVNNMAHEFNTPVSAILASAEVLQKPGIETNPERLHHYAQIVGSEGTRLQKHVEKILQIASGAEERIPLHRERFDLQELLDGVVVDFAGSAGKDKVSIVKKFEAGNAMIMADKIHIRNVFYNLLDNAIKYSGDHPEITVSTVTRKHGIEVCISDNGKGIARQDASRIFEKFYRVSNGNTHDVKGFGLGLNYVKNIVKAHNGTITLKSELNRGSRFFIFLPA